MTNALPGYVGHTTSTFLLGRPVTVFFPCTRLTSRPHRVVRKRPRSVPIALSSDKRDDDKLRARRAPLEESSGVKVRPSVSGNGTHVDSAKNISTDKQTAPAYTEHDGQDHASLVDSQIPAYEADEPKPQGRIPVSIGPLSFSVPPRWLLYSVPFLWGSFAPAVRLLFAQERHQDPSVFNSERLLLSTLIYLPVLFEEFKSFRSNGKDQSTDAGKSFAFVAAGVELGIYVFLANVAQVIGLQQTSASRAAFLGQLQTVFVPIISGALGIDKVSRETWISSLVAVGGVALLSADKGHGTASTLAGDGLVVLSALFFSAYIIRLSKYCNKLPANPLVATKIAVQALLSVAWAASAGLFNFVQNTSVDFTESQEYIPWTLGAVLINVGVVLWTGLLSSALSGWAQTRGQRDVPASEAVVIFATQPLWSAALAAALLGETFGPKGLAGGALILAATLIAGRSEEDEDKKDN